MVLDGFGKGFWVEPRVVWKVWQRFWGGLECAFSTVSWFEGDSLKLAVAYHFMFFRFQVLETYYS